MKEVLISVQPKWCELIANGTKTVEVRKTKPKLNTPFKCYIYCTKSELLTKSHYNNKIYVVINKDRQKALERYGNITLSGKVIGEFVCNRIDTIRKRGIDNNFDYCYLPLDVFGNDDIVVEIWDIKKSCIKKDELNFYGSKSSELYVWHISNLVIYDEPKELSKFCKPCINSYQYCQGCHGFVKYPSDIETYEDLAGCCFDTECLNKVTKPPQSWCYVTESRKRVVSECSVTGGFLKNIEGEKERQEWWDGLTKGNKDIVMSLPNFDKDIFKEITGIDVEADE